MRQRSTLFGITLAASLGAAIAVALAHSGATGTVRERMDVMTDMAESAKTLAKLFRAGSGDMVAMATAASVIEGHAGDSLLSLFPEGSIHGPSEASPAIWADWPEFSRLASELKALAADLRASSLQAAETQSSEPSDGERTREVIFAEIARTCSACHEKFRTSMP